MLLPAAKYNIPHSVCKAYVPCWDDECEHLLRAHGDAQTSKGREIAADSLFSRINEKHRQRWTEALAILLSKPAWEAVEEGL